MNQITDHNFARRRRLLRGELAAAWDHLISAATLEARQLSQVPRLRGQLARDRAAAAAQALRGDSASAPWRWLGAGLAAGVVIGAVGVTVLARGNREARVVREHAHAVADRTRAAAATAGQKAGATVQAAQDGTRTAVRAVGDSARDAAGRVRHRFARDDSGAAAEPTDESPEQAEE